MIHYSKKASFTDLTRQIVCFPILLGKTSENIWNWEAHAKQNKKNKKTLEGDWTNLLNLLSVTFIVPVEPGFFFGQEATLDMCHYYTKAGLYGLWCLI